MEYFEIMGNTRLGGEIDVHGAKNSVLPLLAGCVLVKGECVLHNCPRLSDVDFTIKILRHLGAEVKREGSTICVNTATLNRYDIPEALMREMRSSIIFLGALSGRLKKAKLFLPGGCEIGLRPIDLHIKALGELGYGICFDGRDIKSEFISKKSDNIALAFPSVGATENLILSSVLLEGNTRIINAAREPEIVDLCDFLVSAGAKISGAGNTVIEIEGARELHSVEHTVIPDRILASTLMSASAITSGEIRLNKVRLSHLLPVFPVFEEAGCRLYADKASLTIKPPKRLRRVRLIETRPYPGFPTDSQATACAMLSVAGGTSLIHETIFENRQKHVRELNRFGADIAVHDNYAVINGVKSLHGASASCTDLRGGAAVVLAALKAEGKSSIYSINHIDRGYECFENQLSILGADVKRINNEKESEKQTKPENQRF
mgnify:CR=1 FL=1